MTLLAELWAMTWPQSVAVIAVCAAITVMWWAYCKYY